MVGYCITEAAPQSCGELLRDKWNAVGTDVVLWKNIIRKNKKESVTGHQERIM